MFIYQINDKEKSFKFRRKIYTTPCNLSVKGLREINVLRAILEKEGIKDVKVIEKGKRFSGKKKVHLRKGDGAVRLSTSIRG